MGDTDDLDHANPVSGDAEANNDKTDSGDGDEATPSGFDAWRRRSAAGEVGTAIARGLGAVFAPAENKPVVSAPIPGDPPDPQQGFRVLLDPDDPEKSVAVFAVPPQATDDEEPDHTVDPGDAGA